MSVVRKKKTANTFGLWLGTLMQLLKEDIFLKQILLKSAAFYLDAEKFKREINSPFLVPLRHFKCTRNKLISEDVCRPLFEYLHPLLGKYGKTIILYIIHSICHTDDMRNILEPYLVHGNTIY